MLSLAWNLAPQQYENKCNARLILVNCKHEIVDICECPLIEESIRFAIDYLFEKHGSAQPVQDSGELGLAEFIWLDLAEQEAAL